MKIVITGSAGFIAGYLVQELLDQGHQVIGVDNYSKYGKVEKSYDSHPNYRFIEGDAKNTKLLKDVVEGSDHLIACAAIIGGIALFHSLAYDLLAENERIIASTFDAAIWAHRERRLKKITILSSSMVFENTALFPTPEGEQLKCPPPSSTYGFQKLSCEYFAKGAWEQYGLPYTIVRPFNCIGIGEKKALCKTEVLSGNINLAMSHVVPDLVQKIIKGQNPLHLLGSGDQIRHYTYGGDLAKGIRLCMEHENALCEDFNIAGPESTTVLELAKLIWQKINGTKPFRYICDPPFKYDIQKRIPSLEKAKRLLGFEAKTSLTHALDEIIPWIKKQVEIGGI